MTARAGMDTCAPRASLRRGDQCDVVQDRGRMEAGHLSHLVGRVERLGDLHPGTPTLGRAMIPTMPMLPMKGLWVRGKPRSVRYSPVDSEAGRARLALEAPFHGAREPRQAHASKRRYLVRLH